MSREPRIDNKEAFDEKDERAISEIVGNIMQTLEWCLHFPLMRNKVVEKVRAFLDMIDRNNLKEAHIAAITNRVIQRIRELKQFK